MQLGPLAMKALRLTGLYLTQINSYSVGGIQCHVMMIVPSAHAFLTARHNNFPNPSTACYFGGSLNSLRGDEGKVQGQEDEKSPTALAGVLALILTSTMS